MPNEDDKTLRIDPETHEKLVEITQRRRFTMKAAVAEAVDKLLVKVKKEDKRNGRN